MEQIVYLDKQHSKNVVARTNASALLEREERYADYIGLVAHEDVEIGNDVHTYAVKNVFENILVQAIGESSYFIAQNGAEVDLISLLTPAEFTNADTYLTLSSVWSYDTNLRTPVLDLGVSYELARVSDPGNKITDAQTFIDAIVTISNNLDKEISYTIDATNAENHEFVIDASKLWQHEELLRGNQLEQNPYKGKLIVENGYLVIENLTIESDLTYLGFFGVVSGANTEISNIKFRNVSITSTGTNSVAAF